MGEKKGLFGFSRRMDVIVVVALLVVITGILFLMPRRMRAEARGQYCRKALTSLYVGLSTYVDDFGGHVYYPKPVAGPMSGADFLLASYFNKIVENSAIFICPGSGDDDENGAFLAGRNIYDGGDSVDGVGPDAARERIAVSYAGFALDRLPEGILSDKAPADTILLCDDEEDADGPSSILRSAKSHHDGYYNAVFLDGHADKIPDPFAGGSSKRCRMIFNRTPPTDMVKN